jgi:glycosyltransferase involved in cell wall biosynthesis
MKICIFSPFYPIIKGGAEYQSKIIASYLLQFDEIFYISYGHPEEKIMVEGNIRIYCLKKPGWTDFFSIYYYSLIKINKILNTEAPDIIYQRVLNSYSYHLSNYAEKQTIPLFIHVADNFSLCFDNTVRGIIRRFLFNRIRDNYLKTNFTNFIIQTDEQMLLLKKQLILPVLKIYNMHPVMSTIYEKNEFDYDTLKIIWIGNAHKIKKLEVFINLAKNYVGEAHKFIIIGKLEDSKYGKSLKAMIDSTKNILYLDEKTNDFINSYLKHCFVLINTSESEGFSNTFIQAWLQGIPVISLDSDPDGIISQYDLGYYCHSDINKIDYYLNKLIADRDLYFEISRNCFSYAINKFSVKNNMGILRNALYSRFCQ